MCLKTPSFWYQPDRKSAELSSYLLLPFSYLYLLGHHIHQISKKSYPSKIPVICIGNINAGGSGKTPAAIAIMNLLKSGSFKNPVFLTKGYKGSLKGPVFVDKEHDFTKTGDEALLLNKNAKTIIAKKRAHGAKLAEKSQADLIILDDGLQNPSLEKKLNFVVVDGKNGFGNKRPLPAGPLRESLASGLKKADAFILIGDDSNHIEKQLPSGTPLFKASIKLKDHYPIDDIKRVIGFAGLAHPSKFLDTLKNLNLDIIRWYPFSDHHCYSDKELSGLKQEANKLGARLITTEKDYMRISKRMRKEINLLSLPIDLIFEEPDKLKTFILKKLHERL